MTEAADAWALSNSATGGSEAVSFFFIVGCPRSGTTLLRWMLDSHPAIAVTPETHFAERYLVRRDRVSRTAGSVAQTQSAALDLFCQSRAFEELTIDERVFRRRARSEPADPWRPLRVAMEDFGRLRNASIVGEKTPGHALHLDALAEAFPDARFLMLARDPRAVAASWLRASWSHHSTTQIAETWSRYTRAMQHFRRRDGSRCLEIGFEDLVENTAPVLGRVCEFLGTEFDSRLMHYHERRKDTMSAEDRLDHALTFALPKSERIEAWRVELSRRDLCQVEAICAHGMSRSGYSPATSLRERAPKMLRSLPASWRKRIKRRLRSRL